MSDTDTTMTEQAPPGWMAQLPDDYKGDESLSQFKTLGDFAKAYKETSTKAQELEGKIPKAPESPDEYEFEETDLPLDEDLLGSFKEIAHQTGMTKDQAKAAVKVYNDAVKGQMEAQKTAAEEQIEKTQKALKEEWGDKYDAKVEAMRKGIQQFGSDELNELLNSKEIDGVKLGNHPVLIKYLSAIGEAMADDNWTPQSKNTDEYDDVIIKSDDSVMAPYRKNRVVF